MSFYVSLKWWWNSLRKQIHLHHQLLSLEGLFLLSLPPCGFPHQGSPCSRTTRRLSGHDRQQCGLSPCGASTGPRGCRQLQSVRSGLNVVHKVPPGHRRRSSTAGGRFLRPRAPTGAQAPRGPVGERAGLPGTPDACPGIRAWRGARTTGSRPGEREEYIKPCVPASETHSKSGNLRTDTPRPGEQRKQQNERRRQLRVCSG